LQKSSKELEHTTVYLLIEDSQEFKNYIQTRSIDNHLWGGSNFLYYHNFFTKNPFSNCTLHKQEGKRDYMTITTNYRVIIDNNLGYLLDYQCEPDNRFERRRTIKLTVNIEFLRWLLSFRLFTTTYNILPKTYLIPASMDLITTGTATT
jgi:hypothetical protein